MDTSNLKYAPQMFRHLNGGHFICASSTDGDQRNWYEALEAGWEDYAMVWLATTGMDLARGDGYYYFRKRVSGDRKTFEVMASDYKEYLSIMNLLFQLDQSFGVGHLISRTWILSRLDMCPPAKETCRSIFKSNTTDEWATELLEILEKKMEIVCSYVDDERSEVRYLVTQAFDYYRTFIESIQFVSKEDEDAIEKTPESSLFDEIENQ